MIQHIGSARRGCRTRLRFTTYVGGKVLYDSFWVSTASRGHWHQNVVKMKTNGGSWLVDLSGSPLFEGGSRGVSAWTRQLQATLSAAGATQPHFLKPSTVWMRLLCRCFAPRGRLIKKTIKTSALVCLALARLIAGGKISVVADHGLERPTWCFYGQPWLLNPIISETLVFLWMCKFFVSGFKAELKDDGLLPSLL